MNITQLAVSSIVPYEFNNRVHSEEQIDRISRSIKEFGFNQPIVIDESNVVLVGHGRLFAALKLGLDKVPVLKKTGLSEVQKKAYRILDNKLQNDSTWSFDNLELELGLLEDEGFELEPWGLDDLRELLGQDDPELSEDEGPGCLPGESYIKPGDVIQLGNHTVICGDSTSALIEAKIDLVITDPPYGVSYVGKTKDALTLESDDLDETELSEMWQGCLDNLLPHLKEGGVLYATVPPGPLRAVFSDALKARGILRQELIWLKDSMVMGHSDYHYKHEPILYGWKPGAAHYMTPDRSKTSVLEFERPKRSTEHPTMKPLALWGELITNSSRKGEVVFDPFLGSGTTLIACDQLARTCYGIEIDPKYCQVILERYQKHCEATKKPFICKINGELMVSPIKTHGTESASTNA